MGNADFIQPGLFPLQLNLEEFMETMDIGQWAVSGHCSGSNYVIGANWNFSHDSSRSVESIFGLLSQNSWQESMKKKANPQQSRLKLKAHHHPGQWLK